MRFFSGIENATGLLSPPRSAVKRPSSSSSHGSTLSSDSLPASSSSLGARSPSKRRQPLGHLGLDDVLLPAGDASVGSSSEW